MKCTNANCDLKKKIFPIYNGIPILLPIGNEKCIFKDIDSYEHMNAGYSRRDANISKKFNFNKRLRNIIYGINKQTINNYRKLIKLLNNESRILIIGGGSEGRGMDEFFEYISALNIKVESLDVYLSDNIDIIADAHYLPYSDFSFDVVIIQAVLEHCLDPSTVVQEIYRVLKEGGTVYAETPFLQNVHEGAYDFTRFTHSGHRWLFKEFIEIDSGPIAGVFSGSLFVFSYAINGLFRNRKIGILIRLLFFRLCTFLDTLTPKNYNIDGASCCYFIGYKGQDYNVNNKSDWIVNYYSGAQK
nr:class I SAM-dependent methyltransferase [Prochlorococcus marinus]